MNGDSTANALSQVSNKLGTIAIHHLWVTRLRDFGDALGESDAEGVGPFLHLLTEVGVIESAVCCTVEATVLLDQGPREVEGRMGAYICTLGYGPV